MVKLIIERDVVSELNKENNNMASSVLKKFEEFFSKPDQFTPENMESFVQEMIALLMDLQVKIISPDEKERELARKMAEEMKSKMEEQVQKLCETLGINSQDIAQFINNPEHFSSKDWQTMQNVKSEIEKYKDFPLDMVPEKTPASKKEDKKKRQKINDWVAG
jgi:hypothetical protein